VKINLNFLLFKLFFLSIFFSSVGIVRLPSDTQPYFLLFGLLGLLLTVNDKFIFKSLLWPFLVIFLVALFSFLLTVPFSNDKFTLFRAIFSYSSPLVVILYLSNSKFIYNKEKIVKLLDLVLILTYLGIFLNLFGFNWFVQLFVNRAAFNFDGYRGLVSFFSEQSHMVSSLMILFLVFFLLDFLNKWRIIFVLGAILSTLSGQAIVDLMILFFFFILVKIFRIIYYGRISIYFLAILVIVFLFFQLFFSLNSTFNFQFRAAQVFGNVSYENFLFFIGSDYSVSWKLQGLFLSISTLVADPFVFQLSSLTETDAFERLSSTYEKIYFFVFGVNLSRMGDRVYSAFGTWIVDFGVVGFACYLLVIFNTFFRLFKLSLLNEKTIICLLFFLYISLFKVALVNPVIYLLLFYIYNYPEYKLKNS
jgi:hypothetical protein